MLLGLDRLVVRGLGVLDRGHLYGQRPNHVVLELNLVREHYLQLTELVAQLHSDANDTDTARVGRFHEWIKGGVHFLDIVVEQHYPLANEVCPVYEGRVFFAGHKLLIGQLVASHLLNDEVQEGDFNLVLVFDQCDGVLGGYELYKHPILEFSFDNFSIRGLAQASKLFNIAKIGNWYIDAWDNLTIFQPVDAVVALEDAVLAQANVPDDHRFDVVDILNDGH